VYANKAQELKKSFFLYISMENQESQREMVDYLLQKGADIDMLDEFGYTPLIRAIEEEYSQMVTTHPIIPTIFHL